METKNLVTNVTIGCCLGVSSAFGTGYDISLENIQYYNSYTSALSSDYAANTSLDEVQDSKIIDMSVLEANELIKIINTELSIEINNYFIPNKNLQTRNTLFITCQTFRDYCDAEQFEKAYALEEEINVLLIEKLNSFKTLSRVAFL